VLIEIDGVRIDAGKHLGKGPLRYFVSEIRDFAKQLGKTNFLMVSEIAGVDAMDIVRETGLCGALGVGQIQEGLWNLPQGLVSPSYYFDCFSNSRCGDGWFRNEIVNMIDDHDQIWRNGLKGRFGSTLHAKQLLPAAIGLNMCTSGIPCLYYGTEQLFDGTSECPVPADAFIREAMFGGSFGSFRSRDRHFFNECSRGYRLFQDIIRLRAQEPVLRTGAQYLRPISTDGQRFMVPKLAKPAFINQFPDKSRKPVGPPLRTVVAWSRIFSGSEVLCAMNTDPEKTREAWVLVDCFLHREGDGMKCIYPARGRTVKLKKKAGVMAVYLTLAPGAFAVYK
jgi:hypothetical protein